MKNTIFFPIAIVLMIFVFCHLSYSSDEIESDKIKILYNKAVEDYELGKYDDAIRNYTRALIRSKSGGDEPINRKFNVCMGYNIALCHLNNEDYEKAWNQVASMENELLFSIGSEYQTNLDNQNISKGLRQEFKEKEFTLSKNATVLVQRQGIEWLIIDIGKNQRYIIRKADRRLDIYGNEYDIYRKGRDYMWLYGL